MGEMQPTMTKSELIELISNRIKLPKGKAEQIVNCIFDSMVDALKKGEGIEIRGFGSFTVREYKSYEGRNPRTGTMSRPSGSPSSRSARSCASG
jgi:integration host factor subunit beta